jgi:hypothetical protein
MAEIVIKLVNGELAGKTMQGVTKEVNAAALALKKAEAGTQDFVNASGRLEQAKKLQADMKTQIDATSKASDSLKGSFGGILNQIPGFSQASSVLGQVKGGVGGLTSAFGTLKGAIVSTGIGALVIALIALVGWFAKTDAGANVLSGVFKALGNIVDVLFSKLWNIGDTLKQLFSDPIGFFTNLGEDMAKAAVEGYEFAQAMDAIEDQARALKVLEAETEKAVTGLILQSKNVGLTYKERIELLDKASQIEKKNHEQQLANAIALENLLQADFDRAKSRGTDTDELDQKLKDAQIARINLEKDSINLQEKIDNRRTALLEKQQADQEKAHQAELKRLEERRKAEQKAYEEELAAAGNIEDLKLALRADGADKEIAKIKLDTKRKIDAFKGTDEQVIQQILLAQELQEQQVQAVKDKYAKQAADTDKKNKADQAAADKKALDEKIAGIDLASSTELNQLNATHLAGLVSTSEYVARSQQLAIDGETKKLALIKAAHGVESKEYQDQFAKILGLQKAANDSFIKETAELNKKMTQAVAGTLGVFANLFGELASNFEQGTQQYKDFATAQAVISTIQGAINAYTSALAIPYVGEVLAPIAAAGALAAGYAQVNKIQNTKIAAPVKAETGGLLVGRRHAQGGIDVNAEDGEFIINRTAVQNIGVDRLMDMNSKFSRKMEAGGPVNPFADRGPIASARSSAAGASSDDMKEHVDRLIEAMNQRIDRIQVQNVMTAPDKSGYKDKIDVLNKIKGEANV